MSKFTDELMTKLNVKAEDVHLPAGGVAISGRAGTGKSTACWYRRLIGRVIITDTGSMAHKLRAGDRVVVVSAADKLSPIDQVRDEVGRCAREREYWLLDSWTTLQEQQVAWTKRQRNWFISLQTPNC